LKIYFGIITLRESSASWRLSTVEGPVMRSVAFCVLGKAITSRMLCPAQNHDQAVKAEGDSSVGRGLQIPALKEKAEFLLRLFQPDSQGLE
jgi:hypothetical protein